MGSGAVISYKGFFSPKATNESKLNKDFAFYRENYAGHYVNKRSFSVDLSVSDNPWGCSPLVDLAIKEHLSESFRYPSLGTNHLRSALADLHNLDPNCFLFGFGVDDVMNRVIRSLIDPGDELVMPRVSFQHAVYYAVLSGGCPRWIDNIGFDIDFHALINAITKKTKIIFICNPNNPTGRLLEKSAVLDLLKSAANTMLIIDEAGIEYGGSSMINEVKNHSNLCVLRSFSKAYGLAGFRIGYAVMQPELSLQLNQMLPTFKSTYLAEVSAKAALSDCSFVNKCVFETRGQVNYLINSLRCFGLSPIDTDTNIFLLKVPESFGSGKKFVDALNHYDAHVIDGGFYPGLEEYVRISPRNEETNEKFLKIIKRVTSL